MVLMPMNGFIYVGFKKLLLEMRQLSHLFDIPLFLSFKTFQIPLQWQHSNRPKCISQCTTPLEINLRKHFWGREKVEVRQVYFKL